MRNISTVALTLSFAVTTLTVGSAQQKTPAPAQTSTPKPATPRPVTAKAAPTTQQDADKAVKAAGHLPRGWKGRLDSPDTTMAPGAVANEGPSMKFTTAADGAGIYYKPGMKAAGTYELSASFSQLKPSAHPEGYGLFLGGADLDTPAQRYTYFLVRQDGKYSIRSRTGDTTSPIVDWTDAAAMKDPKGTKTSNTLAVRSDGAEVHFLIGGQEVHKLRRAQANPDGIAGLRVNHNLRLQVDKLTLK